MTIALIILAVLVVLLIVYLIAAYNGLIRRRNQIENAWSQIDVQLKRRHDLVPRLVETVKGHTGYERGTIEAVVAARNRATAATGPASAGAAEEELGGAVRQVFALAEAYPDLKAGESFLALQRSLSEIEDHIQNARRYYNAVVRDFNTKIQSVPDMLVARPFGFTEREFFELSDPAESQVPKVKF